MKNRAQVEASSEVGCYKCLEIFDPKEIKFWTDQEQTAVCPYCQCDTILAPAPDFEVTKEALSEIHNYWLKKDEPQLD